MLTGTTRRFNTLLKKKDRMPAATVIDTAARENPTASDGPKQQDTKGPIGSSAAAGQAYYSQPPPPPISSLPSDVKSKLSMVGSATNDDIFVARLTAWKRLIQVYEDYFDGIIAAQKTSKKAIDKALAGFAIPLQDEHSFLSIEDNGLQQISSRLKEVHAMYSAQHSRIMHDIETDAIVVLEQLRVEVKDNLKLYTDHLSPIYRKLRKQAKEVDEQKDRLVRAVEAYKNKHKDQDAWLIQQNIRRALSKQAEIENSLYKAVQAEYERLAKWEITVAERLKTMIATIVSHERDSTNANLGTIGGFLRYVDSVDSAFELLAFDKKFGPAVKQPMGLNGNSKLADYDYMHKDSESTEVLLEGPLEREKGVLKKFQPAYVVLTKLGYLHCYASQEDLLTSEPSITFHLSECTVSSIDQKNTFVLLAGDKMLGRSKYSFRASDRSYLEHWWNAISSIVNNKPKTQRNEIVGGSLRDSRDAAAAALAATNAPNTLPTAAGVTADELAARNAKEEPEAGADAKPALAPSATAAAGTDLEKQAAASTTSTGLAAPPASSTPAAAV
ncbi:hypothetical protein GGI12_000024 [Dipsacomyces acuminosporus]|nr:hypothetical protein GGI12_000024 [Dipsacomyces acuminosporus]